MNNTQPPFIAIPTATQALAFTPDIAKEVLTKLESMVSILMGPMPWRGMSLLNALTQALPSDLEPRELKSIFYHHDQTPLSLLHNTPTFTLNDIFEYLVRFNKEPDYYRNNSDFYRITDQRPEKLNNLTQQKLKKTLSELSSIQILINDINDYWQRPDIDTQGSRQSYLARLFATQLQCAANLSFTNGILSLEGRRLLTQLCMLNDNNRVNLYHVFIQNHDRNEHIHMAGSFVISQHSATSSITNNASVLFVPGHPLDEFSSPDMLRVNLARRINDTTYHTLLACVHNSRRQDIKNELETESIILVPVVSHVNFHLNLIGQLLTKQKLDIIYSIASATPEMKSAPYWAEHVTLSAANITSVLTFTTTLRQQALEDVDNTVPSEPDQSKKPIKTPNLENPNKSLSLNPININVYIHQDLAGNYTDAILEHTYFNWIKFELNYITGRNIYLRFIHDSKDTSQLSIIYKNKNSDTSLSEWRTAINQYLSPASQPMPLTLHLLLTKDRISSFVLGVASFKGQHAIASLATSSNVTPVHEIGHMLGATHEDASIIYDGKPLSSPMHRSATDLYINPSENAQRFSLKNRENIRQYVSQFD